VTVNEFGGMFLHVRLAIASAPVLIGWHIVTSHAGSSSSSSSTDYWLAPATV